MRKNSVKTTLLLTLLLFSFLLTACGNNLQTQPDSSSSETTTELTAQQKAQLVAEQEEQYKNEYQSREQIDVLDIKWAERGELSNPESFWTVEKYFSEIRLFQDGLTPNWSYFAQDASDVYIMDLYVEKEGEEIKQTYCLNHFNCDTYNQEMFVMEENEPLQNDCAIVSLDAGGSKVVAFLVRMDENHEEILEYYAAFINSDGTWGEIIDILPVLKQVGIPLDSSLAYSGAIWDSRGYIYLSDSQNLEYYVVNLEGEWVGTINGSSKQGSFLSCQCKTPEGVCIWEIQDLEDISIIYLYYEDGEMKPIYRADNSYRAERNINRYGDMIYVYQGAIVNWNLVTGDYERLYIGNNTLESANIIAQNDYGKIIIITKEDDRVSANVISRVGPAEKVELSLVAVGYIDYFTRNNILEFERRHPEVKIKMDGRNARWTDGGWNKLVQELTKDNGPDLILLSREEMLTLQEKGMLADLTDVLPEEMKEQIFSGVLDNGKVGDSLYSLTFAADASTIMVSEDDWEGNSWTIRDVLDIIDAKEKAGKPIVSLTNTHTNIQEGQSALDLLYFFLQNMGDSPFLNLETGECDFMSDDFRRVLETCKKYGVTELNPDYNLDSGVQDRQRRYVLEGNALAYQPFSASFFDFSEDMAAFKEKFHFVGYPTEGDSGNYWYCYDGLAVNKNARNREVIDELLRFFYNEDCQISDLFPRSVVIRKDCIKDRFVYIEDELMLKGKGNSYWSIETKSDGSSYLDEYMEYLNSCVLCPSGAAWQMQIRGIIQEEAEAYFCDDKDVDSVMQLIENRVKLYLYENK